MRLCSTVCQVWAMREREKEREGKRERGRGERGRERGERISFDY